MSKTNVEDGVTPLVVELSHLPGVVMVDSGEGGPERPAYAVFRGRDGDGMRLAETILEWLAAYEGQLDCQLRTVWRPGADARDPLLELLCSARQVIPVALALRASRRRSQGAGGDEAAAFGQRTRLVAV
jgi:hypothetical protein